jgi:hypothetical protein
MFRPLRSVIPGLSVLALVGFAGCDGCSDEPVAPVDGPVDLDPLDPDTTLDPKEPRQIVFDGASPVVVYRGQTQNLRFVVTGETSGLVATDFPVTVDSAGFGATVLGANFVTDVTGGAVVPVRADAFDGNLTVSASIVDVDGNIETATATVQVVEDPSATLKIAVTAATRIPVTRATGLVYVATGAPDCATLLAQSTLPQPSFTATFATVPGTQTFADQAAGRRAAVVVTGFGANGSIVARGCADSARLDGGSTTTLTVALEQAATQITGDYDVLMHMALGDALPAPIDTTVDTISAVLADPAGLALFFVMREAGLEFAETDTYSDAEQNPANYSLWQTFRTSLDTLLSNSLGTRYDDLTDIGAGIRDVITDFEIGGRFTVSEVLAGQYEVHEAWTDAVVYWPLSCAVGDLACARRPLSLADAALAPVDATYAADVVYAPVGPDTERYQVTTAPHGINLNYGAFVLAILEQVVFPSLPNGLASDSLGGVLINVVRCSDVSASISGGDPLIQGAIRSACNFGLNTAAAFAEAQLTDLRVNAQNPSLGQPGLAAEGTFVLRDADRDTEVESLNDFEFQLGWFNPDNAAASQDIATPITGDGVRARTACVDDGQCGGAEVCSPIASYLQVARVSFGCTARRAGLAGGLACSADSQCSSGLCDPVGLGGANVCFEACDSPSDCGAGLTCSDVGGLIDLDTVLVGLGDVVVDGCAAP